MSTIYQDSIDVARAAMADVLPDLVDVWRVPQQAVPSTPLGTISNPSGASNGRGGINGAIATGGATDNRGGSIPGRTLFLQNITCRVEPQPLRVNPTDTAGKITFKSRWIIALPWGTAVQKDDVLVWHASSSDGTSRTLTVVENLTRSDQLVARFTIEEFE